MGKLFDYTVFPLLVPFILFWLLAARAVSAVAPVLLPLTVALNRRLNWACPFIPCIWRQAGWLRGTLMRVGFEWTYCMNVTRRFLTLPLRRRTADFFIVGFPKAGTTSMAAYLKLHPCIDGIDGLHWHETLEKESHFFNGALGRHTASSRAAYRSYFPTVLRRWWVERVKRAGKWLCFDACPVNVCLDYTAERMAQINPNAKLIFMLRDPVSGAFSAEIMLRNLGLPLGWSLMEDVRPADPRFAETPADVEYWQTIASLPPSAPLPEDLMQRFYTSPYALLRSGQYANRIAPFLKHFKPENLMFIDFTEFTSNTEGVVRQVLGFVGADPSQLHFATLPPGMAGDRRGRRMHPSVKRKLAAYFGPHNLRLFALLGREFQWAEADTGRVTLDASAYLAPPPAPTAPVGSGAGGGAARPAAAAAPSQGPAGPADLAAAGHNDEPGDNCDVAINIPAVLMSAAAEPGEPQAAQKLQQHQQHQHGGSIKSSRSGSSSSISLTATALSIAV